jgi:hypothetical protein
VFDAIVRGLTCGTVCVCVMLCICVCVNVLLRVVYSFLSVSQYRCECL